MVFLIVVIDQTDQIEYHCFLFPERGDASKNVRRAPVRA